MKRLKRLMTIMDSMNDKVHSKCFFLKLMNCFEGTRRHGCVQNIHEATYESVQNRLWGWGYGNGGILITDWKDSNISCPLSIVGYYQTDKRPINFVHQYPRCTHYWTSSRNSVGLWNKWEEWRSCSRMRNKWRTSILKRWARLETLNEVWETQNYHQMLIIQTYVHIYRCTRVWPKRWTLKCWERSGVCRGLRAWWSRCSRGAQCQGAWACKGWSRCSRRKARSDERKWSSIYSNQHMYMRSGKTSQSVKPCYILYFVTFRKYVNK